MELYSSKGYKCKLTSPNTYSIASSVQLINNNVAVDVIPVNITKNQLITNPLHFLSSQRIDPSVSFQDQVKTIHTWKRIILINNFTQ